MTQLLKIALALAFLMTGFGGEARTCGACHGKGWKRVFVGVSSYGVTGGRNHQCPNCGQWVSTSNDHYCQCKTCGGTGETGISRGSGSTLYPDEAKNVQILLELLNFGEPYYPDCSICKGSGNCPQCNGAGRLSVYDWETGLTYGGCIACGDSGICPTCRGGKKGPESL